MTENKFFMGFWNYTRIGVLDSKDAAKDWKELGINLAMSSVYLRSDDKNLMLSQLDEAHKNGIQVIVYDERTMWKNLENGEEAFRKDVEDAIEDFGAHPAFYAFFVGDEPPRRELERAIRAIQIVNERSKAYLNFLPMGDEPFVSDYGLKNKYEYEDVLVDAMKRSGLSTVCYDNYAQCYIHNREYGLNSYFDNLRVYRNVAHRVGCDFWTSLLSVPHWSYRNLTEDDIRWQISTAVAHGAKGLQWFYLYTRDKIEDNYRNAPYDWFYHKTPMYDILARQNQLFMKFFGQRMAEANLEYVYHYNKAYGGMPLYKQGDIEGLEFHSEYGYNYIISEFSSPEGDFILVVNNMQGPEESDRAYGTWHGTAFSKWLAPGQMVILEKA